MTVAVQHRTPSSLIDIVAQCQEAIDAMATTVSVQIGKAYLKDFGVGTPPKVLFVPEIGPGKIEPPLELGHAARVAHTCNVYVRGRESGDDVERFKSAYDLADLVIDLVQTAGTGRIEWGSFTDDSPTDTDAFGVDVALSFTFRRDVPHSAARWGLPMSLADLTAQQPQPPPGIPASGVTIDPVTEPV